MIYYKNENYSDCPLCGIRFKLFGDSALENVTYVPYDKLKEIPFCTKRCADDYISAYDHIEWFEEE